MLPPGPPKSKFAQEVMLAGECAESYPSGARKRDDTPEEKQGGDRRERKADGSSVARPMAVPSPHILPQSAIAEGCEDSELPQSAMMMKHVMKL